MNIGSVPGEIGILPENREVTGTPRGVIGPTWASREKREGTRRGPRAPPLPSPNRTREGGRRPPSLVQFGPDHGEGCGHLLRSSSPFPYGPLRPNTNSRNSPILPKIPESLGTFPMSEYSRPIYRSLRLDHFETPRHVPDLIPNSELLRHIKTHKLII